MGLLNLIFGGPQRVKIDLTQVIRDSEGDVTGLLQVAEIDATVQQSHTTTIVPAEHPIEDGSTIADHIQVQPDQLDIQGVISDTPLTFGASVRGLATSGGIALGALAAGGLGLGSQVGSVVGGVLAGSIAGLLDDTNDRVKNHYEFLLELQKRRLRFTVVTGLRVYRNMILTNLNVPVDTRTGRVLRFQATFRQLRIVFSDSVSLPEVSIDVTAANSASPFIDESRKTIIGVTDAVTQKLKGESVLSAFTGLGQ